MFRLTFSTSPLTFAVMEHPTQHFLEAIDSRGTGLSVTFVWHRDRYAHTIGLVK